MEFEDFIGKTIINIRRVDNEALLFECSDGTKHIMYHEQDCCECVYIEDICGDLDDLIGSPILMAEESYKNEEEPYDGFADSETWTFYKFATLKGYVTIRWYGSSNGYYSESASFYEVDEGDYKWKEYMKEAI